MMKKLLLLVFCFIVLFSVAVGWRLWIGYVSLKQTIRIEKPLVVNILPGQHLKQLSEELLQMGLIKDAQAMYVYGRIADLGRKIKVGEFELLGTFTPITLLQKFTTNDVKAYQITFPEGHTFQQMLAAIQRAPKMKKTLLGSFEDQRDELMRFLKQSEQHPEGLFFPSTYYYSAGMVDKDIMKVAFQKMEEILNIEWERRQPNLPYHSKYEALIMASIVEKETGVPEERQQIAGVFVRRLKKNMRLQTDPTIIYGLGDRYKGNITREHLRDTANPYNSYFIKGLPPTPIAMPGREAIHAALNPDEGDMLYFVAKGDGSHQFSATLEAHNAAVREYQLNRVKNYRSSK